MNNLVSFQANTDFDPPSRYVDYANQIGRRKTILLVA